MIMNKKFNWMLMASVFTLGALCSCSDDDNNEPEQPVDPDKPEAVEQYVIAASTTEATYLLQTSSVDASAPDITTEGAGNEQGAATHWLFPNDQYAYGLQYSQGNASECVSYMLDENGKIVKRTKAMEMPNFTAFGTYNQYLLLGAADAISSQTTPSANGKYPYGIAFTIVDAEQQTRQLTSLVTEDLLGDGQYCTLSGFVPVGDKIYTAICPAGYSAYGIDMGRAEGLEHLMSENRYSHEKTIASAVYPNQVYIGIFNGVDNFNSKPTIVKDERVSMPASRYRSQYYPTFCLGENGYLYIFSNSHAVANTQEELKTSLPAGVVRLNTATDQFDPNYYFNIEDATAKALGEKHSFFQVWHMGNDKFLLRLYDEAVPDFTFTHINTFGIFDGKTGTYTPVTGFPELSTITEVGRFAYAEDGKIYLPVTLNNGLNPAIYIIDSTGKVTRGITVNAAENGIAAVWKLRH